MDAANKEKPYYVEHVQFKDMEKNVQHIQVTPSQQTRVRRKVGMTLTIYQLSIS